MVTAERLNGVAAGAVLVPWVRRLRRLARSPKGYLLVALLVLGAVAAPHEGAARALATVLAAVAGAAGMEIALVRIGQGEWRFPSSALLTGLIVGLVISAQEPLYAAAAAGMLGTDAKHVLRLGRAHVFNPAAVGLLAVYLLFSSGQSWWGALANLPAPVLIVLLVAGYFVADRANKLPATLAFGGMYVALFTAAAFLGNPASVTDIFRAPFVNAALFFGFFMVTDPPTSPVRFPEQVVFGGLVAAASYLIYMRTHGLYFLLAAVLIGNALYALWRAGQRWTRGRSQADPPAPNRAARLPRWDGVHDEGEHAVVRSRGDLPAARRRQVDAGRLEAGGPLAVRNRRL